MLNDYCNTNDIDILLLQEVTHDQWDEMHNRNIYLNIGTERRGTAIITKGNITTKKHTTPTFRKRDS